VIDQMFQKNMQENEQARELAASRRKMMQEMQRENEAMISGDYKERLRREHLNKVS